MAAVPTPVAAGTPLLELRDVDAAYGPFRAIFGVSFVLEQGRVLALLGSNGAGKTTIARVASGLIAPTSGKVFFAGDDVTGRRAYKYSRLGIVHAPEGRSVFASLSVQENLESGYAPLPRKERFIPDDIFSLFPVLQSMLGRRGGDLSGGQQQQLAIGRALVTRPKILVLDEPTEGIQPSIIKDIGRAIKYLRDSTGMAILLVEQYLDFCRELADYVYIMDRGEIVHQGLAETLDTPEARRHLTV